MFDVFAKYLLSKADFTPAELQRIEAVSQLKALRKREVLLRAGDVWTYNAFVTHGGLRTYATDAKGAEHIINFSVENWWAGDQQSLASGEPARYTIEAIEPSTVLLIHKQDFDELRRALPVFDQVINTIIYRSLTASQNRIHAAISYSAEEKYRAFLQQFPGFALRLPQHMVASYLGMTTETLSRVRRNMQ
ncbi:Crp/Fnr family transcriptional regulator [Hymenobacter sp. 15J16-1T3B]|uniref:Crp/Fnr family transcriptional regulator n=1 Tax=Hymenobacter sp. 15J16-1T3B TaxID=2886941 RepID=UPI001D0FC03B|nr:Crp/Fnr family transcriptional regulator [Hymenobacter sp. 15J16-1T3B]MCC3159773.1 Crp/Fnr family transcriptional regulator [Hymenobacter sp. 15J16-1T3B]